MRAHRVMSFFVPEHRGHDDLLDAAVMVAQASPLGRLRTASSRRQSLGYRAGVVPADRPPARAGTGQTGQPIGHPSGPRFALT